MSISVEHKADVIVTKSPSGPFIDPNNSTVAQRINQNATLDSSTTPAATKHSGLQKPLSAGTGTIDLTSLPDDDGVAGAVTLLGLKFSLVFFRNPSTNANSITIKQGASNGHDLLTTGGIVLKPGESWEHNSIGTGTAVASGAKTWDLTGTGSQALDVLVVAGP